MNEIISFNNAEFGEIRTVTINSEIWFIGKDVADALGYTNSRKAIFDHVDNEDKGVTKCDTLGGSQELTIINESGLYSLVLTSKLPGAKRFKHWVTKEVLPSIRKTGSYSTVGTALSPQLQLIEQMLNQMKIAEQQQQMMKVQIEQTQQSVDNIKEAVMPVTDNWREEITRKFNRIQKGCNCDFRLLRTEMYNLLDSRAGVDTKSRLTRKQTRMKEQGATKTAINKVNRMDIIEEDKKLREIFSKIVSEYEIRYCA